jgi:hypothetical protein
MQEIQLLHEVVAGSGTKRFVAECGLSVTPTVIRFFDNIAERFGGIETVLSDPEHPDRVTIVTSSNGGIRSANAWIKRVNTHLTQLSDDEFISLTQGSIKGAMATSSGDSFTWFDSNL